jgi:hypothetical protein
VPTPAPPQPAPVTPPPVVKPPVTPDIRPRVIEDRPPVLVAKVELPAPPAPAARPALPPEVQKQVNAAIERGLKQLQSKQKVNGSWADKNNAVALAALPGLTLLECGVPASDERVQKAAKYVREKLAKIELRSQTYTVSLAILFLDKLGDEERPLLRKLALRLLAGQEPDGGWSYTLPTVPPRDEEKLMLALAMNRPRELAKLIKAVEGPRGLERIARGPSPGELSLGKPGAVRPIEEPRREEAHKALTDLPDGLRRLPALNGTPSRKAERGVKPGVPSRWASLMTDNSNTQFAALALWAAVRNGVPAERALRHLGERFRLTQRADGGWNYTTSPFSSGFNTPAMTGVGLLGLGIGHGLNTEAEGKALDDEQVKKGLEHLGKVVGERGTNNLYFLWTLERVGVLYNVREVSGRDWYRHAVDILLERQRFDGAWDLGGYPGANATIDTCLALLILKRANFAEELTRHLEGGLLKPGPEPTPRRR